MKKIFCFIAACVILSGCMVEGLDELGKAKVDLAKSDYEKSGFFVSSLPLQKTFSTKASPFFDNYSIEWDKSKVREVGDMVYVQSPINTIARTIAMLYKYEKDKPTKYKACCSYYFISELQGNDVKNSYVVTIIEKGTCSKTDYLSSLKSFNGFIIKSGFDGNVLSESVYVNGHGIMDRTSFYDIEHILSMKDATFYGYKTTMSVPKSVTKAGGGDSNIDCNWYGDIICQFCGHRYIGNILTSKCPACNNDGYNGLLICSTCNRPIENCVCDRDRPTPTCPRCGKLPCVCAEGGYNPDDGDPGESHPERCDVCNLPYNECPHHN